MDRADLKRRARAQLGGQIFSTNWVYAVLTALIVAVLSYGINVLAGLGWIVSIAVSGPLSVGVAAMYLKQSRDGQPMALGEIFNGFYSDFGGCFLLNLLRTIFVFLWSLLLLVPGIIKQYSYSMSDYVKAEHPEYDWRQCLNESARLTDGHKWELFILDLSFLGWAIVGSLCLGIGTLWVAAYKQATYAQCYEWLTSQPEVF